MSLHRMVFKRGSTVHHLEGGLQYGRYICEPVCFISGCWHPLRLKRIQISLPHLLQPASEYVVSTLACSLTAALANKG